MHRSFVVVILIGTPRFRATLLVPTWPIFEAWWLESDGCSVMLIPVLRP